MKLSEAELWCRKNSHPFNSHFCFVVDVYWIVLPRAKKSEISSAALTVSMCARFVLIPIEIATEFPFLFIYVSWSRAKSFILLMKSAREKMWKSNKPKYVRAKFKFYLFCTWCLIWDKNFIHQHNKKSSAYFFLPSHSTSLPII